MITSRQRRILRQARNAIATGQTRLICHALDQIKASDHRRAVQDDCTSLGHAFKQGLDGASTLASYLAARGLRPSQHTLTQARLAWIDRTLET